MEPTLGEIRMFSFAYAPNSWAKCDGTVMNLQQNVALYSLLGTTFGGNGQTTFNLPDLRGRVPLGTGTTSGSVYSRGNTGGTETVTLNQNQLGAHTHSVAVATVGTSATDSVVPTGSTLGVPTQADGPPFNLYAPATTSNLTTMDPSSLTTTGGGQAHPNVQPSTVLNFCICLQGFYPQRA